MILLELLQICQQRSDKTRVTWSVANRRVIQNPARNEAFEVVVLAHILMEPSLSTTKLSNVSRTRRILKQL